MTVPIRHIAGLGILAVLGFLWLGRGLPDTAWLASDSASYLDFSPTRPHGYPAFLAVYRLLFDDFAYLPAVQVALAQGRWRNAKNPKAYIQKVARREASAMGSARAPKTSSRPVAPSA